MKFILYLYNHLFGNIPGKSIFKWTELNQYISNEVMGWATEGWWFFSRQEQSQRVETGYEAHLATCSTGTGASFPVGKANVHNGDHSPLSGAEFKSNSSSAFPCMSSCVHRDNFISACY
jgi:hypothetical protein